MSRDAGVRNAAYPYVSIDDHVAGRQAVHHLIQLGHRQIAMISADDPDHPGWPSPQGRSEAYAAAMTEAPIAPGSGHAVERII